MIPLLASLPALALIVASYLYWRGYLRCRRAGRGPLTSTRLLSYGLGIGCLALALFSPLEAAASRRLAAHMLQHVLLFIAPLPLLMARSGTAVLLGIDPPLRSRLAVPIHRMVDTVSLLWRRPVAWVLLVGTLAAWHVPAVFQAAAVSVPLHALEHLMFFAAAGLWWLSLVGTGRRRRREYGASLLSVFTTMLVGTAVGALLTFSTTAWYPLYAHRVAGAGGDWLADQQLAGLIMWIPPGVVQLAAFVWLAAAWLGSVEATTRPGKVPS